MLGAQGEVEFIRNHQLFGKYIVLTHSISTFLREGDVSLIDSRNLEVAAIGELKTQKISDKQAAISIFLKTKSELPTDMLPKVSNSQDMATPPPLDAKILDRLKRQVANIEKVFQKPLLDIPQNKIGMDLGYSKLAELHDRISIDSWGHVKVGRGLLLVGMKFKEPFLMAGIDKNESYQKFLNQLPAAAVSITDKSLPDNTIIFGSMLYPGEGRYKLGLRMRPLFWWPLDIHIRHALTFKRMVVMTLYNPAFLADDWTSAEMI